MTDLITPMDVAKLVYALCEDIAARHSGSIEFDRGARFAAKHIAIEVCAEMPWPPKASPVRAKVHESRYDRELAQMSAADRSKATGSTQS